MAEVKREAIERELKRFMRPDWRRFWRPGHEDDPLYRLYERIERKYSPEQPRVPAGSRESGQWTSDGGSSNSGQGARVAARRISPAREAECELQRRKDEFICKAFKSEACYGQAMLRYANCLRGLPIPPLNF